MTYDSFLNDDDEQRGIDMFSTLIVDLHEHAKKSNLIWAKSILDYVHTLLQKCCAAPKSEDGGSSHVFESKDDGDSKQVSETQDGESEHVSEIEDGESEQVSETEDGESKQISESEDEGSSQVSESEDKGSSSSQDNLRKPPHQLPLLIGEIMAEIAYNTMNGVDVHDTTISILNILAQFSWGTRVIITIASYILTYGDNGLNLCHKSKVVGNEFVGFLWDSITIGDRFHRVEEFPTLFLEDASDLEVKKEFKVAAYSVIRVFVIAASSQLMTRSSTEDRLGTFSITWCSNKLKAIQKQLDATLDEKRKFHSEGTVCDVDNEDERLITIVLPGVSTRAKDIELIVKGDKLVVKAKFWSKHLEFPLGNKIIHKQRINALISDGVLHLCLPKIDDPQFLHINIRSST